MPRPIILRIDDEPEVLQAVERDVRHKYGKEYRVMKAISGHEGLSLLRQVAVRKERTLKLGQLLDNHGRTMLLEFYRNILQRIDTQPPLDPIARNDLEDELQNWLDEPTIAESWNLAPTFVNAYITLQKLGDLSTRLASEALPFALDWLCAGLSITGITSIIETGSQRISELVQAIKDYSYMDQMLVQDVDIHDGLENTVRILSYKLRKNNVSVDRHYNHMLPQITAWGSQLKLVWTNLLDNAIDTLSSRPESDSPTQHSHRSD